MGASLRAEPTATPRESLAALRASENKSALHPQEPASALREVAKDAIRRVGKQSAAASDIGIHEGRLAHKLSDGTLSLAELEKLGPHYAAEFGRQLLERFGPLSTPYARAQLLMRQLRALHDELGQVIDFLGERSA